jgi:hypothetical protein
MARYTLDFFGGVDDGVEKLRGSQTRRFRQAKRARRVMPCRLEEHGCVLAPP